MGRPGVIITCHLTPWEDLMALENFNSLVCLLLTTMKNERRAILLRNFINNLYHNIKHEIVQSFSQEIVIMDMVIVCVKE